MRPFVETSVKGNVFRAQCKKCPWSIIWHMPVDMANARCDICGGPLKFVPTHNYYRAPCVEVKKARI